MTPGLRRKISTFSQLALAARRSRYRVKSGSASDQEVAANTWADYNILRFVKRNINVRIDRNASPCAWFIVPELNSSVIFGGYIALFQFIKHVQALGIETGIIALKPSSSRE